MDLIACMAALSVLAALAASGISSSNDNVNRMVCGSNMRQLALALGMYACDNQDYLPYCNWDGGFGPDPTPGWLYTLPIPKTLVGAGQETIPDPFQSPWNPNRATSVSGLPDSAWQSGSLFVYMKMHQSYLCPTDIQSPDWVAEPRGSFGPGRNNKLSSYQMNGASCNFGSTPAVSKVTDVWSPDCYLFWEIDEQEFEEFGQAEAFGFNDGAATPDEPPDGAGGLGSLHGNNGGEVVTVGGNVNFITLSTFQFQSFALPNTTMGPSGQTLAWWAPQLFEGGRSTQ